MMFPVKQFAGRVALAVTLATLPISIALAGDRTCTVVTNGRPEILMHEVGHCNGWHHPAFDPVIFPPREYAHAYDGKLIVIMTRDDFESEFDANTLWSDGSVNVSVSGQSVANLCAKLWGDQGISPERYQPYLKDIAGCSVEDR